MLLVQYANHVNHTISKSKVPPRETESASMCVEFCLTKKNLLFLYKTITLNYVKSVSVAVYCYDLEKFFIYCIYV